MRPAIIGSSTGWSERLPEAVEAAVLEVLDARREMEAQHGAKGEDVVRVPAAVGVVPARCHLALVVEQGVEHAKRLACESTPKWNPLTK